MESSHSLFLLIGGVANAGIVRHFGTFSLSQEYTEGTVFLVQLRITRMAGRSAGREMQSQSVRVLRAEKPRLGICV